MYKFLIANEFGPYAITIDSFDWLTPGRWDFVDELPEAAKTLFINTLKLRGRNAYGQGLDSIDRVSPADMESTFQQDGAEVYLFKGSRSESPLIPADTDAPEGRSNAFLESLENKGSEGAKATVETNSGMQVEVIYQFLSSSRTVGVSHFPDGDENTFYPKELQPRYRSAEDIAKLAKRTIRPSELEASESAANGAPIVGADGIVESGNGRMITLMSAYYTRVEAGYLQYLHDNASKWGLDASELKYIDEPVLVRVRQTDLDRAEFAKDCN